MGGVWDLAVQTCRYCDLVADKVERVSTFSLRELHCSCGASYFRLFGDGIVNKTAAVQDKTRPWSWDKMKGRKAKWVRAKYLDVESREIALTALYQSRDRGSPLLFWA